MIEELRRRLKILNQKKVPVIKQDLMRGGMQSRIARQEIKRYGNEISRQKERINNQLNNQLSLEEQDDFSILSTETLCKFNEPKLKRIRSRRGFF